MYMSYLLHLYHLKWKMSPVRLQVISTESNSYAAMAIILKRVQYVRMLLYH